MLVDPALGNLFKRRRVQVMELFAAAPKRNNQFRPDQQTEMFTDALARHIEVATEFVQGLSVVLVKLI